MFRKTEGREASTGVHPNGKQRETSGGEHSRLQVKHAFVSNVMVGMSPDFIPSISVKRSAARSLAFGSILGVSNLRTTMFRTSSKTQEMGRDFSMGQNLSQGMVTFRSFNKSGKT